MNAGKDYKKARRQAQANANYSGQPRYLHSYGGAWWISKDAGSGGRKKVSPKTRKNPKRRRNSHRSDWAGLRKSGGTRLTFKKYKRALRVVNRKHGKRLSKNPQRLSRAEIEKVTFAYYKIQDDLKWLARELGRKQVWPRETIVQDIAAKLRMSIPAVRQVVESIR